MCLIPCKYKWWYTVYASPRLHWNLFSFLDLQWILTCVISLPYITRYEFLLVYLILNGMHWPIHVWLSLNIVRHSICVWYIEFVGLRPFSILRPPNYLIRSTFILEYTFLFGHVHKVLDTIIQPLSKNLNMSCGFKMLL